MNTGSVGPRLVRDGGERNTRASDGHYPPWTVGATGLSRRNFSTGQRGFPGTSASEPLATGRTSFGVGRRRAW